MGLGITKAGNEKNGKVKEKCFFSERGDREKWKWGEEKKRKGNE